MTKERPILFSCLMVRAILDGRKSQTRRVIKPQPEKRDGWWAWKNWEGSDDGDTFGPMLAFTMTSECPYGAPGDQLWVRETWWWDETKEDLSIVQYRASGEMPKYMRGDGEKWRPPIHMPRWASRITLEIVSVRVERVQEITELDAGWEGFPSCSVTSDWTEKARPWFRTLWDSINAKRGFGWEKNPFVWVLEFKRI